MLVEKGGGEIQVGRECERDIGGKTGIERTGARRQAWERYRYKERGARET